MKAVVTSCGIKKSLDPQSPPQLRSPPARIRLKPAAYPGSAWSCQSHEHYHPGRASSILQSNIYFLFETGLVQPRIRLWFVRASLTQSILIRWTFSLIYPNCKSDKIPLEHSGDSHPCLSRGKISFFEIGNCCGTLNPKN